MTTGGRSDPLPGEGDELTALILSQSYEGVAVPVLLFGPAPAADPPGAQAGVAEASETHDPAVRALADRLQLDLDTVALHSSEAYVLQCGLGQELLDSRLEEQR